MTKNPIDIIDGFLTDYKKREAFSGREVQDILLDIRFAITSTGGATNGSIQEGSAAPDRTNPDDREPAYSGSESEVVS